MAATSVTGYGNGMYSPPQPKSGACVRRVLWIEGDDGNLILENIPGIRHEDIMKADLIITDKGRIIKDRYDTARMVKTYDLVTSIPPNQKPAKKTKTKYRSIYEASIYEE